MPDTYGEILDRLVDKMAKFDDRSDIFRRNDIPRGHFYNVINPNKVTSGGNPFYTPIEWMIRLTRDGQNFSMIKKVAKDCGCICITPDEVTELKGADPERAFAVIQKIMGFLG